MLDEIRQKPRNVRERYATWGALGVTGVIALVWFIGFAVRFQENELFVSDNSEQTASAFSNFIGDIKDDAMGVWQKNSIQEETSTTTSSSSEDLITDPETEMDTSSQPRSVLIATSSNTVINSASSSEQNQ